MKQTINNDYKPLYWYKELDNWMVEVYIYKY